MSDARYALLKKSKTSTDILNGQPLKHLYLIIMGAPEHHADVMTHGNTPEYKQYPYEFQVTE